jgi:hypothetical protein
MVKKRIASRNIILLGRIRKEITPRSDIYHKNQDKCHLPLLYERSMMLAEIISFYTSLSRVGGYHAPQLQWQDFACGFKRQ